MAENYQKIVNNLFTKRFCLKSRKRNFGAWNDDEQLAAGDSNVLPDPELLFVSSDSKIFVDQRNLQTGDCDWNGNRSNLENNENEIFKEFVELKERSNATKSKLADKDIIQWHDHTKRTNPASTVVAEIRRLLRPEMCTQAWCKFYEILVAFPNLVRARGRLRTLHLCEAPGAFIHALNYYTQRKELWIRDWDWRANSLNPYYEGHEYDSMIGDDRFIFQTAERWIFGSDDTGDVTSPLLLDALVREGGEFDLVTADGSVDCQEDPNGQERQLLLLHYCETVCAFHSLCKGGSFVLKRFTMFERGSIALLYLICCAFEEVTIFKPATSKSGNSEIYVVCELFKGLPSAHLAKLRLQYGQHATSSAFSNPIVPLSEIPASFLKAALAAQKFFIDHQLTMVEFNLATFRCWTPDLQTQCDKAHSFVVDQFLITTGLLPSPTGEKIIISDIAAVRKESPSWLKSMPWRKRFGTYVRRQSDQKERPRYVLQNLVDDLNLMRDRQPAGNDDFRLFAIDGYSYPLVSAEWYQNGGRPLEPVFGRRLSNVNNSKFCHGQLMMAYWNLREACENGNMALQMGSYELESLELCQFLRRDSPARSASTFFNIPKDEDCLRIDLNSNAMTKLDWLDFLVTLISAEKAPKSFELTRSRFLILTRFSSNILVVLCVCYQKVALIERAGTCTVKAENYRPLPPINAHNIISYLHRVRYGLSKRERNGVTATSGCSMDLLQFLPMECLSEPSFCQKTNRFNDTVLLTVCQEMLSALTKSKE